MSHPLFEEIEKLIDERGSAEALKGRLALLRDSYHDLEARQAELEEKIRSLEDQVEMSQPRRIEEVQERILILLASHSRMTSDQITEQLQIDQALCSLHIKELDAAKLILRHHVLLAPAHWSLGLDGRRYLESNELMP